MIKTAIIALAWAGAVGWPLAGLAGLAVARLRRSRILLALAALATIPWALAVWAVLIEPATLTVREVRAESPLWRGAPIRIGIISDVHVGHHMSPARVGRVAARMNALEPDIVLLAGDYVSGFAEGRPAREIEEIEDGLHALGRLDAPLGVIAVLGNHDWWFDGDDVETWLTVAGLVVLENDALRIERDGGALWVAGLADEDSDRAEPDWRAALARAPPGADVIAVAHRPDVFMDVPEGVALTVAGHSHCGQINLAPLIPRFAISEGSAFWPCGLYEEEGRRLYVTGGLGVSVLPARFRAPPEIVLLTLAPAAAD